MIAQPAELLLSPNRVRNPKLQEASFERVEKAALCKIRLAISCFLRSLLPVDNRFQAASSP
jgi:hypothetical protein